MALRGIKVVELAGLAPAPFCGMILADFGATVTRIDKINTTDEADVLRNGKLSVSLNLKHSDSVKIVRSLCKQSDVLLEPFRKGVMERLGLGPEVLMKDNPKLIYARLTGFGQDGYYSTKGGHDINYVGLSGLLSLFGRSNDKPVFPVNLAADFGGGGLMCALGILLALIERQSSNLGQVIDCNMTEGTSYLGSWLYRSQSLPIWGRKRGENVLDTGTHFYEVYETKDNKYMAVGALEPQFYANLLKGLELDIDKVPHYGNFEESKKLFTEIFKKKTQKEWCDIFDHLDACVTPVVSLEEAPQHRHNFERKAFEQKDGINIPKPAPILSRTPGVTNGTKTPAKFGEHTRMVLRNLGYDDQEIDRLSEDNAIFCASNAKL